ncbi:hypothetical protein BG015_009642 [Linnemannia schmuckeri]|uniref:BZIP domain-containing protein n=1 Tax=Linnemannia schmuckeri TaxID=64567 RepID=A0A9P5V977_9FUNG|nr:hypothetical protein BG015_009642 [Linnemannia schmuckeri]
MNGHLNQYPAATAAATYNQHQHTHPQQHQHTQHIPIPSRSRSNNGKDTDHGRDALESNGGGENNNDDDPEHLPDDDLIRWANAQFTVDYQPGVHSYEDELALKIAHSQRQQYHAQQQAMLHRQQQLGQGQGQFQAVDTTMHGGYIDSTSAQDSRTGLSLVERSRQRNPQQQGGGQLRVHYDPRVQQAIYTQQQQQAYLIQQQQQFQAYPAGGFPSSLPSSLPSQMAGIATPQEQGGIGAQQFLGHLTTTVNSGSLDDPSSNNITITAKTTGNRGRVNSVSALSSLSLVSPGHTHPSSPSLGYFSHQEKLQQLESELEEYENELAEERRLQQQERASSSSSASSTASATNQFQPHQQHQQQIHQQGGGNYQDQDQDDMMDDTTFSAIHSAVQSPQGDAMNDDDDDSHNQYVNNQTLSLDPEEAARQAAAAEEDKRRRNTAASARFRQKKRLREQILEKTAKEMTAKSEILEARARELEMEIKWLRGLIVEKGSASVGLQGVGPAVLPGGVGMSGRPGGVGLLSSSLPNSSSFLGPESFAGSSKAATAARRPRKIPPPLAAKPAPPSN